MKLNGYTGTITNKEGYFYNNGITDYKILIPDSATESEKYAGEELALIFSYAGVKIETVTDANLTINCNDKYISVGNTIYFKSLNLKLLASEFKFDGFIIESVGNTYVIKGVGDTGTCFGVYGFMEYIAGYRYYAPDEIFVEKVAQNKEFHIKDIPTFYGRNAYSYDSHEDIDYSFRLRINGEYAQREKKHGEGRPWSTLHDQSYALQILDYTKYAKDHPDWYTWCPDHEKFTPPQSRAYPQICYSKGLYNEEFYNTFITNLINDYIIPESDKIFFMLGMSDNTQFCDCETCNKEVAKYTRSGLAMRFVNKVADDVEKWRKQNAPERVIYVIGFAYLSIFDAPVIEKDGEFYPIDESVIARDNVIIQYAPIRANYMHPLMDKEHNLDSRNSILGWTKITKNLCVWDYRQDFGTQTFFYPTTITAQENNDLYMQIGVMDVFNQAQPFTSGSPFMYMDNFARARLHWNGKENYRELINEFNKAYYKDAYEYVNEYLEKHEKYYYVMMERGYTVSIGHNAQLRKNYYKLEEIYEFKAILDKALEKANAISDAEIREKVVTRVETLTLFYKFALLFCFTKEIEKEEAFKLIEDLRVTCKKVGLVTFWRRTDTEEYLQDVEKLLKGEIDKFTVHPLPELLN